MPTTVGGVVVDPQGQTLVVDVTNSAGNRTTVYSAANGSSTHTLPKTITERTEFHVAVPGDYQISTLLNGSEIANNGAVYRTELANGNVTGLSPTVDTFTERASQSATTALVDAKGDLLVGSAADSLSRLAVGAEGDYFLAVDPDSATGLGWNESPVFNLKGKRFGAVGDGVADDHDALAAFSALVNAQTTGVTVEIPKGVYRDVAGGGLNITAADCKMVFHGGAWIAPEAGVGITWNGARGSLHEPRVAVNAGSPTHGIRVMGVGGNTASFTKVYNPVVRSNVAVPAGLIGIDVWDNCTWVEIFSPHVRKANGADAGTFTKGIRFGKISNSGRVWGGALANCDACVEVDGSNAVNVLGTAMEQSAGIGVSVIEPTAGGNGHGGAVAYCRFEMTGGTCISIAQTTAFTIPMNIGPNYVGGGTILSNVNAQAVRNNMPGGIRFLTDLTKIEFRNSSTWFVIEDTASGGSISASSNIAITPSGIFTLNAGGTERLRSNSTGLSINAGAGANPAPVAGEYRVGNAHIAAATAGRGFMVKEGSNAKQGTSTLVGGTVTVANTSVTANSRILLTAQSLGTVVVPQALAISARTAGTSFTILSADATDTSVVAWEIFEPAT